MRLLLLSVLLLSAALPRGVQADTKFEAGCNGSPKHGFACAFTNTGDRGRCCIRLLLRSKGSGVKAASMPVCSGVVDSGQSVTIAAVVFSGVSPDLLCEESGCDAEIEFVTAEVDRGALFWLRWFFSSMAIAAIVIGTSAWVFFDAKRIRASLPADVIAGWSPTEWMVGSLLLWLIVFPVYLRERRRLRAAVAFSAHRTATGN